MMKTNNPAFGKTKAKWIWGEIGGANCYCRFSHDFTACATLAHTFNISADSNYSVFINGHFVGAGQYADYPEYKVYDQYDIDEFIVEGKNTVAVLGYCYNEGSSVYKVGQPGVLFSVFEDDEEIAFSGGESWWAPERSYLSGPSCEKFSGQLSYGFAYDASIEDDWYGPGAVRGQQWKPCKPAEYSCELYPRPIKRLDILPPVPAKVMAQGIFMEDNSIKSRAQRMQTAFLSAREISYFTDRKAPVFLPDEAGVDFRCREDGFYIVVDLGAETVGWLFLDLETSYGTQIDIGFGEHLDDLRVRSFVGNRCFAVGYTTRSGRQTFIHRLKRLGCRYLQLHIHSSHAKIHYVGLLPTVYPVSEKSFLRIADHLHDKIYSVCKDTLKLCMHEHYEDCPWREQALYAMDSRNQMLCGYYAFGEYEFAKSSLNLLALGMREDGLLALCAPADIGITIPSFSLCFVVAVWEYMLFSGDRMFGKKMLPVILRIMETFTSRLCENGLLTCFAESEYWNFYEWSEGLGGAIGKIDETLTYDLPLNAFFSMALHAAHMICSELGDDLDFKFFNLRSKVNQAICDCFWDRAARLFCSFSDGQKKYHLSELSQSLAVCCGAADHDKMNTILPVLANGSDGIIPVTLAYSIFKYDALFMGGQKYACNVLDEIAKIWGGMLYQGATSFYETAEGAWAFNNAGSLCHGWSAVPLYIYYKYGLGISPTLPGFESYRFSPYQLQFTISGDVDAHGKCFEISVDKDGKKTLCISRLK